MSRTTALLLAALLTALPASAAPEPPTVREQRVWFTCAGEAKLQNLAVAQGDVAGWDTTPPTGSATDGAGCASFDSPFTDPSIDNVHDAVWRGTFTGNLSLLTLDLHAVYAGAARTDALPFLLALRVEVDGWLVYETPLDAPVAVDPARSETGLSERILVTLRGLPFVTEYGEGTRQREITVAVGGYNEQQSAWVWDTTEVPAGITFNPSMLAPTVVDV